MVILQAISQFLQGIVKKVHKLHFYVLSVVLTLVVTARPGRCPAWCPLPLRFGLPPPQIQPRPYISMNGEIISAVALPVGSSSSFSFSPSFIYLTTKAVLQCTHAETRYLCFCLQKSLGVPWTHSKPLPLSSAIKHYSLTVMWISRHSLHLIFVATKLLLLFFPHSLYIWLFVLFCFVLNPCFHISLKLGCFSGQYNFILICIVVLLGAFNKSSLKIPSFYHIIVISQQCWQLWQALKTNPTTGKVAE